MSNASPRSLLMRIEETLLALILALMCGLTFYNVVLRGWFNGQFLWGLEATLYLFAWLVLLGLGYLTRTKAHLGVDALINLMSNPVRMVVGVIIGICCIIYALLLLKGAYDFVANYYNLPRTIGRVIPEGFEEMRLQNYQGFKGVFDIPMPDWLRPIWEPVFLLPEDPPYRRLAINIPYIALWFGVLWMLLCFIKATYDIARGVSDRLIASHEVEDALHEVSGE